MESLRGKVHRPYNRLITLQHGHFRRVRRMKNGGVWRRLAGSLLGTRQIYLCGAVRGFIPLVLLVQIPHLTFLWIGLKVITLLFHCDYTAALKSDTESGKAGEVSRQ